ncbi:MAG: hypothetical protein WAW86_01730 [Gammaproteobacteria bacterium]
MQYYPTAKELLITARHKVSRDKILVLVGGSSIFRGVGQNQDELWTNELQKQLGDEYKVLNYANDSATFTSFGAVAFRMLIEEYPKIIFVSSTEWATSEADGIDPYKYIYWDAYYKNLFHPDKIEMKEIRALRKKQIFTAVGAEQHIVSYLDSWFYFKNLWNWVGYRFVFSVWDRYVFADPFVAKRRYHDVDLDFKKLKIESDKSHAELGPVAKIIAQGLIDAVDLPSNKFKKVPLEGVILSYENAFSPRYRSNILCVVTTYNPKYVGVFPDKSKQAYKIVLNQSHAIKESLGYHSMIVKSPPADSYQDLQHLLAPGGKLMATQIAPKIKEIAVAKHYIKST